MCFYHDETAEVWRTVIRKARKEHRCWDCQDKIQPGQRYEYGSGIFDGEPFWVKTCPRCLFDRRRIFIAEQADGCKWHESFPATGELHEALMDRGWDRTPLSDVPADFDPDWIQEFRQVA